MILLLQGMTKGDTANPYHRWICISQTKEVISCGQKTKKNDENTHLLYGQMPQKFQVHRHRITRR